MLRVVSRAVFSRASAPRSMAVRSFADHLGIATDKEQQAGRRKEELDAEAQGLVGFNRDPIIPAAHMGTKEHPILVRFY